MAGKDDQRDGTAVHRSGAPDRFPPLPDPLCMRSGGGAESIDPATAFPLPDVVLCSTCRTDRSASQRLPGHAYLRLAAAVRQDLAGFVWRFLRAARLLGRDRGNPLDWSSVSVETSLTEPGKRWMIFPGSGDRTVEVTFRGHSDSVSLHAVYGPAGDLSSVRFSSGGSAVLSLTGHTVTMDTLDGTDFLATVDVEQVARWLVSFELATRCALAVSDAGQPAASGAPVLATQVAGSARWVEFLAGGFTDAPMPAPDDGPICRIVKRGALRAGRKPLPTPGAEQGVALPREVAQALAEGQLSDRVVDALSRLTRALENARPVACGGTDDERRVQNMGSYISDAVTAYLQVPAGARSDARFDVDPHTEGVQTAEDMLMHQLERMTAFVMQFYVRACSESAASLRANGDFLAGVLPVGAEGFTLDPRP